MMNVLRRVVRCALSGLFSVWAPVGLWAADPVVSNVRARQLPGSGKVEVLYDLSGAPAQGATVSVVFSADGGGTFGIVPGGGTLSGQVGAGVRNEINRQLVWDAAPTLGAGAYGVEYRARVTAVESFMVEEMTVTLPGGVPLVLVRIPAGTFMMGSPVDERGRVDREDLHQVTLTQDYYLGKYEVTQLQWQAVMGSNPAANYGVGDDYPVYYVSWNDICGGTTGSTCTSESFIGRLNAHLGTTKFRLPTEAEWERAARAGTQTRFSHGDVLECGDSCEACTVHDQYMWWCGNNSPPYGTKPVGSKQPNGYGLYDMHGNVWEWVADGYTQYLGTSSVTDPAGLSSGSDRVRRGGGWYDYVRNCRSADRVNASPSYPNSNLGFRLARSP